MEKMGASELMRSLGLLVDGPARWGVPIPSRAPGVFLVELPGGAPLPPLDQSALRRWLERVPSLMLDGQRPTVQQLSRRLAADWQAGQPVLYVGRSAKSIGARLAAIYATPLGDARPSSAGHWLKTLSAPGELRVWWADTDAGEEYEDALLEALGAPPFANHAFEASLRDVAQPVAVTTAARAAAQSAARSAATRRPATRRATVPKDSPLPAPQRQGLSREGLERLTTELEDLRTNVRPTIIARVKAARELGDLRENGDYEYARKEQSFVEGRIQALEHLLRTGVIIDQPASTEVVHLGSTVELEHEGERVVYLIVSTAEAKPSAGRLSDASPVGRALLGARAGDEVVVQLPGGAVSYRVVSVG